MGRAFGEYRDRLIARHGRAQIFHLISDAGAVFAVHKDGVVDFAKPPNQWPALNPVIGDKGATGDARHHGDVYPAVMVGGVKHIRAHPLSRRGGCNTAGPADRQKEQARPRRWPFEKPPEIVEEQARDQAGGHQQQPGGKQKLAS